MVINSFLLQEEFH